MTASALRLLISDEADEPEIRGLARAVLAEHSSAHRTSAACSQ